jgi:hypothetical protein
MLMLLLLLRGLGGKRRRRVEAEGTSAARHKRQIHAIGVVPIGRRVGRWVGGIEEREKRKKVDGGVWRWWRWEEVVDGEGRGERKGPPYQAFVLGLKIEGSVNGCGCGNVV